MIGLGLVLLTVGILAAWNVHSQQQSSSELISREVQGLVAIEELHLTMREIRYQVNMFLRTRELQHLTVVTELHGTADPLLDTGRTSARTEEERNLIQVVDDGYSRFFSAFTVLASPILTESAGKDGSFVVELTPELASRFTTLTDDVLTNDVLRPLRRAISYNESVVERANDANRSTAQHLKVGFLLLGICGGGAGLLMGLAFGRAIRRFIVQLNVSVRGVAGQLSGIMGPVMISQSGGLPELEMGLRHLEKDIAEVVERLEKREAEVLRSEQLAHVGQLAAGLAHELRNPLMPMKMLVQAALERGDGVGLKGRSLQVLNDEISRLESTIQMFLDFARPPALDKTEVDLNDIVLTTVDLVRGQASCLDVKLRTNLSSRKVIALIDRTQIRQLVLNLLLNALDAQPNGGSIEVKLIPEMAEPKVSPPLDASDMKGVSTRLKSSVSRTGGDVLTEHDALRLLSMPNATPTKNSGRWFAIIVSDDGPGIPAEMLDKIFEPYITTKETGTGLGLSICQRIAAAHGGVLSVANRASGGAEFTLRLPYQFQTSSN